MTFDLNTALLTVLLAFIVSIDARVRGIESKLMTAGKIRKGE